MQIRYPVRATQIILMAMKIVSVLLPNVAFAQYSEVSENDSEICSWRKIWTRASSSQAYPRSNP